MLLTKSMVNMLRFLSINKLIECLPWKGENEKTRSCEKSAFCFFKLIPSYRTYEKNILIRARADKTVNSMIAVMIMILPRCLSDSFMPVSEILRSNKGPANQAKISPPMNPPRCPQLSIERRVPA